MTQLLPPSRMRLQSCFNATAGIYRRLVPLVRGLPLLRGAPITVERAPGLRDRRGAVHGAAFLRERRIALDCSAPEFPRIFVHELFHFVWLYAGNPVRHSFEQLLRSELGARCRGELGWSAEWRKRALTSADIRQRSRRWREYCCESFCDTAAWLYSGVSRHPEFTLAAECRSRRRAWFTNLARRSLSI
jgi:hypothetical protein